MAQTSEPTIELEEQSVVLEAQSVVLLSRAHALACAVVETYDEAVTDSHTAWLTRECAKLLHRQFAVSAREEVCARREAGLAKRSSSHKHRYRHHHHSRPNDDNDNVLPTK